MTTVQPGTRMTLAEYRLTPEFEGVWELIDGVLEKQPPATVEHQLILGNLIGEIISLCLEITPRPGWPFRNVGVAFSETFAPTPDIVYVRLERMHLIRGSFFEGTPDLLAEVLSKDRDRDLIRKRAKYAAAGVPEYWIVDPANEVVIVLELSGGEYKEIAVMGRADTLTTPTIPGFALPLEQLFGDPIRALIRANG